MDSLISWLCACTFFVPTALGLGITAFTRKRMGKWGYLLGWSVPLVLLVGLYVLYNVGMRATPCLPPDSLACGENVGYALVLFLAMFAVTFVLGVLAQVILWFVLRQRDRALLAAR